MIDKLAHMLARGAHDENAVRDAVGVLVRYAEGECKGGVSREAMVRSLIASAEIVARNAPDQVGAAA